MTSKWIALALIAPVAASLVAASGCTITSSDVASDDASPGVDSATPPDGGSTTDGGGALGFVPSNVPAGMIDFTDLDDIDVTADAPLQASTAGLLTEGAIRYKYFTVPQTNGPTLGVFVVKSLKVEAGATLNASGGASDSNAIVIVAQDTIDIEGSITAFANQNVAYAGGSDATGKGANTAGIGPGGGGAGTLDSSPGGGGFCVAGGAGASISGGTPSAGGPAAGTPNLVPLLGGSTGGAAGLAGGAGGGAIQLVAKNAITIGGKINVGGGGGSFGGHPAGQNASAGGSGGAILLEAPTVTVSGGLFANGGGGGATGTTDSGSNGQASATPTPGGGTGVGAGGAGGAGATPQGQPGVAGDMQLTSSSGGGGGSAGRIRINTQTGSATLGGTLSPSTATPCVTQGTLAP